MISAVYGSFNMLALDLVKRSNPHISDLGRITEGEKVWLPPVKKETLIRKQPDSSFHLVVGAFRNQADAHQLAQDVREQGYIASVTTYQVTADLAVSRVQIGELADLEAVDRAWTLTNVQLVPGGT
jgi:cell division septation protein DedD